MNLLYTSCKFEVFENENSPKNQKDIACVSHMQ